MCDGRNDDLGKAEWRKRLAAARAGVSTARRVLEARALTSHVASMALPATVCMYVPFGTEPGSVTWLDAARAAGSRVLLPVIPPSPGELGWAEYTGPQTLSPGRLPGVLEPSGSRLGAAELSSAGLILVPALAVDRRGVRLGRGAGFYDRTLSEIPSGIDLVAVVRDDELVDRLPAEPHDVRMTAALLPERGLVSLPLS